MKYTSTTSHIVASLPYFCTITNNQNTQLMNLNKQSIKKILTDIKNHHLETELLSIDKNKENKIQDIPTAHFDDLVPFHIGAKPLTRLNQKRYRRGGIYSVFSPAFDIDEVTHITVDLHTFKGHNISLTIFELRAFLRRLKQKYNYEIVFIQGLELVELGENESKDKAFKEAFILDQLKTIRDELFIVMVIG